MEERRGKEMRTVGLDTKRSGIVLQSERLSIISLTTGDMSWVMTPSPPISLIGFLLVLDDSEASERQVVKEERIVGSGLNDAKESGSSSLSSRLKTFRSNRSVASTQPNKSLTKTG